MNSAMRSSPRLAALVSVVLASGVTILPAQFTIRPTTARHEAWSPEVVEAFRRMPVQEGGRVKPLGTAVSFMLLRLHGTRTMRIKTPQAEALSPVEWALDCLFHPVQASDYPLFQVQTSAVLDAIQLPHQGKRARDRYSYRELSPAKERLMALAKGYSKIPKAERGVIQTQVVHLARNFRDYELLCESLSFARIEFDVTASDHMPVALAATFVGKSKVTFSEVLRKGSALYQRYTELKKHADDPVAETERRAIGVFLGHLEQLATNGSYLTWLPPSSVDGDEWASLKDLVLAEVFQPDGRDHSVAIDLIAQFETLIATIEDKFGMKVKASHLVDRLHDLAEPSGDAGKVDAEVAFYEADYFYKSLLTFLFAFLTVAVSWVWLRARWLRWLTWGGASIAAFYLVAGIIVRSVLLDRSPVATLYETILFVTAVGTLTALFIEWITRRKVALSLGVTLGAIGMTIALGYEVSDGRDTMAPLVAVLRSNFWLSTHVTSITIGYAACLLAGFIGHVYLLGRLFQKRPNAVFYASVARMVYGVTCFGLLFSLVGTILGGIWANDSWGRFWGWDPKENGALMIVLWGVFMLHGRGCGWLRDFGFSAAAVAGNIVVAFSWWGVNLLGVGLHSYGFTSGIAVALWTFYALESLVLLLGLISWNNQRIREATLAGAQSMETT